MYSNNKAEEILCMFELNALIPKTTSSIETIYLHLNAHAFLKKDQKEEYVSRKVRKWNNTYFGQVTRCDLWVDKKF